MARLFTRKMLFSQDSRAAAAGSGLVLPFWQSVYPDVADSLVNALHLLAISGLLFAAGLAHLWAPDGSVAMTLYTCIGAAVVLVIGYNHEGPERARAFPFVLLVFSFAVTLITKSVLLGLPAVWAAATLVFLAWGWIPALITTLVHSAVVLTLTNMLWGFGPLVDLVGLLISVTMQGVFLYGLLGVYEYAAKSRSEAQKKFEDHARVREQHYRALSLIGLELRPPAANIYMLSQLPPRSSDSTEMANALEQLAFTAAEIDRIAVDGAFTTPMMRKVQPSLLFADTVNQIYPKLTFSSIELVAEYPVSDKVYCLIDAFRFRGAVLHLLRMAMLLPTCNRVSVALKSDSAGVQHRGYEVDVDFAVAAYVAESFVDTPQDGVPPSLTAAHHENEWVEQLVSELDGELLWEATESGLAAKISCRFPLSTPDNDTLPEASHGRSLKDLPVLVVDDDPISLSATVSLLRGMFEANVIFARSGNEAFKLFKERTDWALVITDFVMPDGDGRELTRNIRRGGNNSVAVVVSTASALMSDVNEIMDAGASLVLPKPLTSEVLNRVLREVVDRG